jgi:hypothetical protein
MSKWSITCVLVAVAATAIAGKRERELMAKETIPAAKAAEARFKESCGCPLAIVLDGSLQTEDHITFARLIAEEVSTGAPHYCTNEGSRRAMCRMRTLKIAASSQWGFTFDDGVGLATTNGRGHPSWDTMTRAIDQ